MLPAVFAAVGLREDDLADLNDDLIAAYEEAVAREGAERQAPSRTSLVILGRHLAAQVGAKAAGMRLN